MLVFLLVFVFVLGTIIGSTLNVCIYRMPLEKSVFWPGSTCGRCLQPIRWFDNVPLVSYLVLRGRCRSCGASYSVRYFLVELLVGLLFAGLFYLEVIDNIHGFDPLAPEAARIAAGRLPTWVAWTVFGYHAVLVSLLVGVTFCDLDHREIPLSLTVPGTVLGLIGALLWAWPWPYAPAAALGAAGQGAGGWIALPNLGPKMGLFPWPFWAPLPAWFQPGGNWQTGLATGLAGALAGTLMLRVIRFVFGLGLGIEALGLGDADLMMMAGSFLGWQPIVVAFFIGVFAGLIFGVAQMLFGGDNMLPFGPALAIGIIVTFLTWRWIGPHFQLLFFNGILLLPLAAGSCILMLVASYFIRVTRMLRGAHPQEPPADELPPGELPPEKPPSNEAPPGEPAAD